MNSTTMIAYGKEIKQISSEKNTIVYKLDYLYLPIRCNVQASVWVSTKIDGGSARKGGSEEDI